MVRMRLRFIEVTEEQRVRVRLRVPSAMRTEYEYSRIGFHRTRTRTQGSGTRTRRLFSDRSSNSPMVSIGLRFIEELEEQRVRGPLRFRAGYDSPAFPEQSLALIRYQIIASSIAGEESDRLFFSQYFGRKSWCLLKGWDQFRRVER